MNNLQFKQLIESYIQGHCPAEALLDAAIEMGVDVDTKVSLYWPYDIKTHLMAHRCQMNEISRAVCDAINYLRKIACR